METSFQVTNMTDRFMSNMSFSHVKYLLMGSGAWDHEHAVNVSLSAGLPAATEIKQDETANLLVCNLPVREQTDTLTFSVLPSSSTSTCFLVTAQNF